MGSTGAEVAARNREGKELILQQLPRYVRVNTLKTTFGRAKRELKKSGHMLEKRERRNKKSYRRPRPDPKVDHRLYGKDPDVPGLLVFAPKGKSDISSISMVRTGELVVQQKASCFPALALSPPPDAHVIDACAAPGSKTAQLAALMGNRGKIFAFDRSQTRIMAMQKLLRQRGVTNVTATAAEFQRVDPHSTAYARVTHIMLDPSCSSSGMSAKPTTDPHTVSALASAQLEIILHAFQFPSCERVCYSTCSVNVEENEVSRHVYYSASHSRLRHICV